MGNKLFCISICFHRRWRSPEELKEHYQHLEDKEEVIVSCGSGGSACLNLVGLKIAGIKNVTMYSGRDKGNKIKKDIN